MSITFRHLAIASALALSQPLVCFAQQQLPQPPHQPAPQGPSKPGGSKSLDRWLVPAALGIMLFGIMKSAPGRAGDTTVADDRQRGGTTQTDGGGTTQDPSCTCEVKKAELSVSNPRLVENPAAGQPAHLMVDVEMSYSVVLTGKGVLDVSASVGASCVWGKFVTDPDKKKQARLVELRFNKATDRNEIVIVDPAPDFSLGSEALECGKTHAGTTSKKTISVDFSTTTLEQIIKKQKASIAVEITVSGSVVCGASSKDAASKTVKGEITLNKDDAYVFEEAR